MTVQPPHETDDADEPTAGAVTKRRVTMRNFVGFHPDGTPAYHEAVDFVPEEILDAYTVDARSKWGFVEVGGYDPGPGGYHGPTVYPAHLPIPNAGEVRPPTPGSRVERAMVQAEAEAARFEAQPPDPRHTDPTWNPTPPGTEPGPGATQEG